MSNAQADRVWLARVRLGRLRDNGAAKRVENTDLPDVLTLLDELDNLDGERCVEELREVRARNAELVRENWRLTSAGEFQNDQIVRLRPEAEAWRKGMATIRELQERVIPCGHKVEDLIGGDGAVTKCGACLRARQEAKDASNAAQSVYNDTVRANDAEIFKWIAGDNATAGDEPSEASEGNAQ